MVKTPTAAKVKKPAAAQKLKLDEEQKEPAPTVVEVVEEKKPEEKKPKAPQPKKAKAAPAKKAAAPKTPVGTGKKPAKRKTVTEQLLENMFDGEAAVRALCPTPCDTGRTGAAARAHICCVCLGGMADVQAGEGHRGGRREAHTTHREQGLRRDLACHSAHQALQGQPSYLSRSPVAFCPPMPEWVPPCTGTRRVDVRKCSSDKALYIEAYEGSG